MKDRILGGIFGVAIGDALGVPVEFTSRASLEAGLYCLLKMNTFEETVLTAVNLGDDTDTVGAIAGGLAGTHYGLKEIPTQLQSELRRTDDIRKLGKQFADVIHG